MDALLSERRADGEVIDSLVRANRQKSSIIETLEEQLKRSKEAMLIRSTDGNVYRVHGEAETLSAEQIAAEAQRLQEELAVLQPAAPANGGQDNGQAPTDPANPGSDGQAAPAGDGSAPAAAAADPAQATAAPADASGQAVPDPNQVTDPNAGTPAPQLN